ncbi:Nif3-like dinuclear metal center hexameric protein [Lentibacillus saliphilus]|uniref:Nif3-like dinuclear metal center hexameric protein n=1 Tax=Lentibacillus saliphilus TaxID=2737028 RepID=UPI001C2F42E3|nr:Nif3-like dinuclear metal center hexameric protein [Lentibacillus saliphilus]
MTEKIVNQDVIKILEQWAPKRLAYDWDNVGLQLGSINGVVKNILVTLDVTHAVVDEAIRKQVDLIIAHHPLFFRPVQQIDTDSVKGRLLQKLLVHNITVYAAHTNLDITTGGVNDLLCEKLAINQVSILDEIDTEVLHKVVVYVPNTHADNVRNAMGSAGGGYIGQYSHCTFNTQGTGTFLPTEQANPYIGHINELTYVEETKIETIVPETKLQNILQAMIQAHPYEEVAYDVYKLDNKGEPFGIGRIGRLTESMPLATLAEHVKDTLNVPMLRVVGDVTKPVQTVAVLGGSGEKYIQAAMNRGADVLITGDLTFHVAQDAQEAGLALIDPGHHVEKVMKDATKLYLDERLNTDAVTVYVSDVDTEPFQFV